jgi:hypothetical protein
MCSSFPPKINTALLINSLFSHWRKVSRQLLNCDGNRLNPPLEHQGFKQIHVVHSDEKQKGARWQSVTESWLMRETTEGGRIL